MSLLDVRHPWFNPLWRRLLTVAAVLGWTAVEIAGGNLFWAILFGSAGLWLAWQFLVVWKPQPDRKDPPR
jgi:hypothetical protein